MRQIKAFMKAKKPMWRCGECKCLTLQCWKENDEFCNCGESVTPPTPGPTPEPTLIDSVSNFSTTNITVDVHEEPGEITFEYSPAEWNSWIELQYDETPYFTAEITSLENWQWVITITPMWEEDMAEDATVWVYLEATQDIEETITVDIAWP